MDVRVNQTPEQISDALRRTITDLRVGAHYPTVALVETQLAALRYLVDQTPQRVESWEPRHGNLGRDEVLARLQAAFYTSGPDVPETLPGAKGERLDVSRPGGPGWGYRSGVADALGWILSKLSHVSMNTEGNVTRIEGFLK
jgi:hypothetical protein